MFAGAGAGAVAQDTYKADARALLDMISREYAYLDRFDGENPALNALGVNVEAVTGEASLLEFAECALNALRDHHAIMGVSSSRSYGLVPSHADLWVEVSNGRFMITDVRRASPAAAAGLQPGMEIVEIAGAPVDAAVDDLCGGPFITPEDRSFAARVLAAGRRDSARHFLIRDQDGAEWTAELDNLYRSGAVTRPLLETHRAETGALVLRFNDSLGEDGLIEMIDAALLEADESGLVIDLRDTPGGGNTLNARALLGRFVSQTRPYQRHELTRQARATGVSRLWVEEVAPRGEHLDVPVAVLVGRWTGSMGEGIAIGFDHAAGAPVVGSRMAGLRGAIYDLPLPGSGWVVKLPVERLSHVDGTPREAFTPSVLLESSEALDAAGRDIALSRALAELEAARARRSR